AAPQPVRTEAPAAAPPAVDPPPIRAAAPQAPPAPRTVPGHSASAGTSRLAATPRARSAAPVAPVVSVLRQQVVALWGGKPGAGRSTLALALSDLISQVGAVKVCTVDLNPANSSLAPLLGKDQELPSWVHLAEGLAQGRLNLTEGLRWVRSNWAIISGAGGRDEWSALLTPANLGLLVDGLRSQFDYIILDTEARAGALSDAALRLAQTALLVVSPDYPDVVDSAKAFQGAVERGAIDRTRSRLVLNRWIDTQHLPADVVAECFELPVSVRIPCSYEAVISAAGQGVPVTQLEHPGAKVLLPAFRTVVQLVAGQLGHTATAERSSLGASLRGLFGRA
ncbi:MAG TPA: hypothetical protein VK464_07155, partial [Symbiobacteriaceae bacterium]|nr:hypothetical protein [Symbiobacteriaceae bacterium]